MLKIRRYKPEDNKVVKELNEAGLKQINPEGVPMNIPNLDADFDDIEGVYFKGGDFIVGEENGEVVAMGAFKPRTKQCAEFKRLRIKPDRQRKGYGENIMRELMRRAAAMGYTEGFLDTLVTNTRAQKLFEKLGFKRCGRGKTGPFDNYYYSCRIDAGGV
jgi:ribosomal protein S18 acetylase RimI-like enzyme